jgi:hypothetical protein
MSKIAGVLLSVLLIFSFFGCATPQPAARASSSTSESTAKADAEATDAAMDALARMQNGGAAPAQNPQPAPSQPAANPSAAAPSQPAASQPAASAPSQSANRGEPGWVSSPESVYPKSRYVSAVGSANGNNRASAEKQALASLIAIFGQSIQADLKMISSYTEQVTNNKSNVRQSESVQNTIKQFSQLDNLMGAEIADGWYSSSTNIYWAVAVMDNAKTISLYADLIRSTERLINELVNIAALERATLEAYSRYQLAATIADANRVYANILTYVGDKTSGINPSTMKGGNDYRLEAAKLVQSIPIGVIVANDVNSRISGAFREAISGVGFRSGGSTSRYILRVSVSLSPVDLPSNPNKFTRYVVDGNLMDMYDDTVLLPYNINGREGHLNQSEADNRAIRGAETKIKADYNAVLKGYLSSILPSF